MTDTTLTSPRSDEPGEGLPAVQTHPAKRASHGARIYENPRHLKIVVAIAVLTLGSIVDISLAKSAFDSALRLVEALSWLIAIGFGVIAVAGAFYAGVQAKLGHRVICALAALAPVTIAIALFILRTHPRSSAAVGFEGAGTIPSTGVDDTILAPIMLLVFIGTAVLAFIDGYHLTDPLKSRFATTRQLRSAATTEVAKRRGRVVRIAEEKSTAAHVLRQVPYELANALNALEATADELKQWARIEIAQALGDPRSTSGKTDPAAGVTTEKLPQKNDPTVTP